MGLCSSSDLPSDARSDGKNHNVTKYAEQMVSLFTQDVFLVIFNSVGDRIWSFISSTQMNSEFQTQLRQVQDAISATEQTIRNLNEGWRVEELNAFRLVCLSSRIWVWLLNETHRFVVINRVGNGQEFEREPPDLSEKATALCEKIRDSILGPPGSPVQSKRVST
jgi:LytS/YehU family sensor histidine kinase